MIIGLLTLLRDDRAPAAARGVGDDETHGHDHSHGGPRVAWLLVLPVLGVFLVAPPALGSYAANRAPSQVTERVDVLPPMPKPGPDGTVRLGLANYISRTYDGGTSLQGTPLRLTGFASARPDGGVYLTRMVLSCCAGDGRPVKVVIDDPEGRAFPEDTWLQVDGTFTPMPPPVEGAAAEPGVVAAIRAQTITRVPTPAQPYE